MGTSVFSVPSFLLPLREHEPFIKSSLQEHTHTHKCPKGGPERIPIDETFIGNTKLTGETIRNLNNNLIESLS